MVKIGRWEPLEPGDYAACVVSVAPQDGRYGPQVRLTFGLDATHEGLLAWAPVKLSPRTKLGRWTVALLGELPEAELETNDLLGRPCVVRVGLREAADGSPYNVVLDVLPAEPEPVPEGLEGTERIRF